MKNKLLFAILRKFAGTKLFKLMLPIFALLYWVWPFDLMPFIPIDDIGVVIMAAYLFLQDFSNPGSSQDGQHSANNPNHANSTRSSREDDGNVIDTTWRVVK